MGGMALLVGGMALLPGRMAWDDGQDDPFAGQMNPPDRRDDSFAGQKTPFATPGCLWSTYGPTLRAEDRPEAFFATRGCH